jgi:hypothetical protein
MQTPVCQTGICVCAKTLGVTLISDSTITSLTAKRDTQSAETLLHSELKISFYRKSLVLRIG